MDHLKENVPVNDETMEQVAGGALSFFHCNLCGLNWPCTSKVTFRGQTMCYACKLRLSQQSITQPAEDQSI